MKKSNLAAETCDIQYGKLPSIALSCFVYPSKVSFLLGLAATTHNLRTKVHHRHSIDLLKDLMVLPIWMGYTSVLLTSTR
jgi:hypothetical protein